MARLKILIFLLALAIAGTCIGVAWWFYTREFVRDEVVQKEIKHISGDRKAPPDPGLRRFDLAMETMKNGDVNAGKEALYDLIKNFPTSKRAPEAKRIIGEINLDMLFSPEKNPQKQDYVVQTGNSLGLIATKHSTTVEAIQRFNGMMSSGLQPGDHLGVFPLNFELAVNLTKKTVTLIRNERFFKEYQALDIRLPAGVKAPLEMTINDKPAWFEGKRVQSTHPNYLSADKWLNGSKVGLNLRSLPQARAVTGTEIILPKGPTKAESPKSSKSIAKGKSSTHSKNKGAKETEVVPVDDSTAPALDPGIYLPREDMEELFTLIRMKTKVKVVR
jgi:LysM repeat protein